MIINTQTVKKSSGGNNNYAVNGRILDDNEMIYPSTKTPQGIIFSNNPADYTKVDWVKNQARQYINTGINVTSGLKVVDNTAFVDSSIINGCHYNESGNPKMTFSWGTPDGTAFKSLIGSSSGSWASTGVSIDNNFHTWELENGSQKFDGVQYGTQNIISRSVPLYLFGWNTNGNFTYIGVEKRARTKFYVDNVFVADLISAYHTASGISGMFDAQRNIFFVGNFEIPSDTSGEINLAEYLASLT